MMIDTGDAYDNRSAARAVADARGRGASLGSIRRPRLRAGTVLGLEKNRGDRTVVRLAFETGGKGPRVAGELVWRKAELKGKDKPQTMPITV